MFENIKKFLGIGPPVNGAYRNDRIIVEKSGRYTGYQEDYERYDAQSEMEGIASNAINAQNELMDFMLLYQIHPWVYTAVSVTATAIASIPYQVVKKSNGEETKSHPICDVLCNPNPHQTWFEFMELTAGYLELTGNTFWEELRENSGRLRALFINRPDKMRIVPHPKKKIVGYIYMPRPGHEILYNADEVTHLKYMSPLDEYWGISPAYAAQNSIVLDIFSTTYNKKFFTNSAVPEGVLETEQTLSDETYRRLRQSWMKRHQGNKNAFQLGILEEGLKYNPIGFNQRDMQMIETKKLSREEILSAYRVPPAMVGLLEHANYATSREQRKMFWMDNILPKLEKIRQVINRTIMPDDLELRFVTESINSIIEDIKISTEVAMSLVSHGIMTINEVRKKLFAMSDVEWGDEPWMPVGLAQPENHPQTADPEAEIADIGNDPSQKEPDDPQQAMNQSTPMGETMPNNKSADFEKITAKEPDWDNMKKVADWKVWSVWKGLATPDYIELRRFMDKFFEEQMKRIIPKIRANYKQPKDKKPKIKNFESRIIEEAYEIEKAPRKKFSPEVEKMLFNLTEERGRLKVQFIRKAKRIVKKHGDFIVGDIGAGIKFNLRNHRVEEFLEKRAGSQIGSITTTTRRKLGNALTKALENGEDFDDVLKRVNIVFKGKLSESRARTIARTETVTLTQFARLEGAIQSGVVKKKRWVTAFANSRDEHIDMHDTTINIEDSFSVPSRDGGINEMFGPGDPTADASNLVNCLCVLDYPSTDIPEFESLEGDVVGARKSIKKSGDGIEVHVHMPKQPDTIIVNKGTEAPPVQVNVPQQPAPKVENIIKSPDVKIQMPSKLEITKMPKRRLTQSVDRDNTGKVQRTEQIEEDAE